MTDRIKPIRNESAWFRVNGVRRGKGVVLLYPDRLVRVRCYAEYACWIVMIVILDVVAYHILRDLVYWLVPFFGILAGALAGLGREVRATPLGLAVAPRAVDNGA